MEVPPAKTSDTTDANLTYTDYSSSTDETSSSETEDDEAEEHESPTPEPPNRPLTQDIVAAVLNEKLLEMGIKPNMTGVSSNQLAAITEKMAVDRAKQEKV